MLSVTVRIGLRYLAGILIARGLLSASEGASFAADPDVAMLLETGLGVALGLVAEGWYWLARRFGWAK